MAFAPSSTDPPPTPTTTLQSASRARATPSLATAVRATYGDIDEMVGQVMEAVGEDTTLIVMSDHGFAPFRRQAHLNAWLEQQGYLTLRDPEQRASYEWLLGIDWARTRARPATLDARMVDLFATERRG